MRSEGKLQAALLWDESFLWGIMAYKALLANGLAFDLIRSGDVRKGILGQYKLLFVPGGWASNKIKALGEEGVEAIRQFVHNGGSYLGFCGGAGLATSDGIGLLPVKRRPTKERVPSFSGRVFLNTFDHPIWQGVSERIFHAWWPSQFQVDESVSVLATYGRAMPDSFSSDINVGDAEVNRDWSGLEQLYQINLDPRRLINDPAVVEGRFGKGKVLLSLVHFDTRDDKDGAKVLKSIWTYLGGQSPEDSQTANDEEKQALLKIPEVLSQIEACVADLIDLGHRNFLWFWRNPLLLQWRRGVRGLEYCTLYGMVKEIGDVLRKKGLKRDELPDAERRLSRIRDLILPFADKANRLLILERFAMQNSHITYDRCDDSEIQTLREELFSRSKSYGGLFKNIIDELDRVLYGLILQ